MARTSRRGKELPERQLGEGRPLAAAPLDPSTDSHYAEAVANYNDAISVLGLDDGEPLDDPSAPLSLAERESLSLVALKESVRLLALDGTAASRTPWRAKLAADALVLHGRIVEWRQPEEALRLFGSALEFHDSDHKAANLEFGRLQYKLACSSADLASVEAHLEKAAKDADDDQTRQEAQRLLARLYRSCGPGHKWGGKQTPADKLRRSAELLHSLGYKYALTHELTAAKSGDAQLLGSPAQNSHRLSVTDEAFPPKMLAHLIKLFRPSSNFWADHRYSSPSTGFFSYSVKLSKFPAARTTKPTNHPSSFVHIIHHIWATAAVWCPLVRNARFAEWWAHSRPHSNGHALHFDYVVGPDGSTPLHPIASTISFITASVGGPTLVTSQTMSKERSSDGWLVFPQANRLAHFDGSLLHCVLPGSGFNPVGSAERRLTLMVAFWENDPRSTPHPTKPYVVNGKPASWVGEFNEMVEGMEAVGAGGDGAAIDDRNIRHIDRVVESVAASEAGALKRRKKATDVDLLGDDVFSFFGALDSGILIQNTGCSLNCQGGCAVCRPIKSHK